jgi:hypothetical protein
MTFGKLATSFLLGTIAVASSFATAAPAAPATQPATQPAVDPAAEAAKLTGSALNIRAQQTFNRGEYALALPLLKKLASETEAAGQTAKLSSIQERIRVCETALKKAKEQAADPQAALTNRPPADNTPEARKPHPAPTPGKTYELTIQGLGNFDYDQEKGGNIPADVTRLSGSSIRLKGYMIPMDQAENITQFALVPSLFACCFGQPPQIQHTIVVNCPKGKAVGYTADEILVEGTLKVQEKKDDGYINSVFEMEVSSVKLAPKG